MAIHFWGFDPEQLSPPARRVVEVLGQLPLASREQLARALGWQAPQLVDPVRELVSHDLMTSVELGSGVPGVRPASRWFLTVKGTDIFDGPSATWHTEGNRCVLLQRFPAVDALYEAAVRYQALGKFREFLVLDRGGLDGAVRYENGWIGVMWSGMLEKEKDLTKRFDGLYDDFLGFAGEHPDPWPSIVLVVVPDRWQREAVQQVTADTPYQPLVATYCVEDGQLIDAPTPGVTRGWIHRETLRRSDGKWTWATRLGSSIWTQPNSQTLYRILRAIAEFPGMPLRLGRETLREAGGGKNAERCCRALVELGLVDTVRDGNRLRYVLSSRGLDRLAAMERGTKGDYRNRAMAHSWVQDPARRDHEDGAMRLLGQFRAAGLPAFPGWRYYEDMGGRALAPDGMVILNRSPYGPGWHFVEYERSARSPAPWRKKLRGLAARQRRNQWPALFVCFNENAERNLHQLAGELGLRVVTTTIDRHKLAGPLDNFDCWSLYGHRVQIG